MTRRQDDRERFVRDVLARTSGSPCVRAESLLPDLTDGVLVDLDRQLVQAHLEHCGPCRSLAVAMGWAGPVLPQLAAVDPGPAFTAAVLARTSRRQRLALPAPHARPGGVPGLVDRLGRWWGERVLLPGFAPRVAYAATVVLVLLTSVPGAPFRAVPAAALKVMQAGPTAIPPVATAAAWVDDGAGRAVETVRERWLSAGGELARRGARSVEARRQTVGHLGAIWRDLTEGRLDDAGYEGLGAVDASRRAWTLWWHGEPPVTDE